MSHDSDGDFVRQHGDDFDIQLSDVSSILGSSEDRASWAASDRRTIGRYQVVRKLGQGGHGDAYLAHAADDETMLTVKLLRRELSEATDTHRLWRELAVLERCRCAAVPRLVDHGLVDGRLYMAYEYVDGSGFDTYAHERCHTDGERVDLLIRVCDAVQMLHERAVIHRDLKPSNLLVGDSGQVFVVDMGTSIILDEAASDATRTLDGVILGTPAFMAPEQARGDRASISTRSDVFSIGAIACRMLTGQTPFAMDGPYHQVVRKVATGEPRRPRSIHPKLARGLDRIVARATAANPGDRYASVGELRADLDRWRRGLPIEAAPTFGALARQAAATVRRRPWISGVAAVMALVAIASASAAWEARRDRQWNEAFADRIASVMRTVSGRATWSLENGDYYGALQAIRAMAGHVRAGGTLDDGLLVFSDQMEDILDEEIRKVENGEPVTGHLPDGGRPSPDG